MDKKDLKQQYKQMKPKMGVFAFSCLPTGKTYLGMGKNTKADINSITFQLNFGNFPCGNLQADWKKYGADNFTVEVLEELKYDKDQAKTDYTPDLKILRQLSAEKFDNFEFIDN